MLRLIRPSACLLLIGFTALLTGCSGLANTPVIIRTAAVPSVTPTSPPDRGQPAQPVSLLRGATIYSGAQGCQTCHGVAGKGDGPVAASLTCKIPDLSNPDTPRPFTLTAWFAITTNGNGQTQGCLMPPWKNRLTEQQRWDVTAFMYSLNYKPATLEAGKALYAENCAGCHGTSGKGDGPNAKNSARPVTNIADTQYMITHSDNDIFKVVTSGLGAQMPAFPQLSDDQRWSVTAYARSLSWLETIDPGAAKASANIVYGNDRTQVVVQQTRLLLDLSDSGVIVQQGVSFANTSAQLGYVGKDGVSVQLRLPNGATQITLDADMRSRYAVREGTPPIVYSTRPLEPGETRPLVLSYALPLTVPFVFTQVTDFNTQAVTIFFAEETGLTLTNRDYAANEAVTLQSENNRNVQFRQFAYTGSLFGGLPLTFTLDRLDQAVAAANAERRNLLAGVIGLSLTAFALIGVGVWRLGRNG